jgi:hypothetical protein
MEILEMAEERKRSLPAERQKAKACGKRSELAPEAVFVPADSCVAENGRKSGGTEVAKTT